MGAVLASVSGGLRPEDHPTLGGERNLLWVPALRAEDDSSERSGRAGGRGDASDEPIEVLVWSAGAFGMGIPGGCAVRIGGGFRSGTRGWFDRYRCWKRIDGESLESRLLFLGQRHLPGNPPVHVHRQLDVAVTHAVLHEFGVSPRFDVQSDVRSPKIMLADTHDPERRQCWGSRGSIFWL